MSICWAFVLLAACWRSIFWIGCVWAVFFVFNDNVRGLLCGVVTHCLVSGGEKLL